MHPTNAELHADEFEAADEALEALTDAAALGMAGEACPACGDDFEGRPINDPCSCEVGS